ncbi:MAG: thioesterase family protein [Bacteroidetes bacterium]|nr:thioesterase family protein [Bacteroidota bacterium]MBS1932348.1 thioesterase family protein [Bacteroidota bacterium]
MARIKIDLPENFLFTTKIPVRITDLNYGGHVGNDIVLSIIHEARVQFLQHYGYAELNFSGVGLIMSDVGIEFRHEIFYGDQIKASVTTGEFSKVGFDIFYKLEKETSEKNVLLAIAKTGMICYNYDLKKIAAVPDDAKAKLIG